MDAGSSPAAENSGPLAPEQLCFPAVGDGLWVRSRGFARWPAVLVEPDRYEPAEQKVLAKHPEYVVVRYFGTDERAAVNPKMVSQFETNLAKWSKSAHKHEGLPEAIEAAKVYLNIEQSSSDDDDDRGGDGDNRAGFVLDHSKKMSHTGQHHAKCDKADIDAGSFAANPSGQWIHLSSGRRYRANSAEQAAKKAWRDDKSQTAVTIAPGISLEKHGAQMTFNPAAWRAGGGANQRNTNQKFAHAGGDVGSTALDRVSGAKFDSSRRGKSSRAGSMSKLAQHLANDD